MADPRIIAPPSETIVRNWTERGVGHRVIVEVLGLTRRAEATRTGWGQSRLFLVRVRCDCGREDTLEIKTPASLKPRCADCGRRSAQQRRCTEPGKVQAASARDAFCEAAADRAFWESDTAEARIAESAVAKELGRLSLAEIGTVFEISRERVRQLEAQALAKLRAEMEREEWRAAARRVG